MVPEVFYGGKPAFSRFYRKDIFIKVRISWVGRAARMALHGRQAHTLPSTLRPADSATALLPAPSLLLPFPAQNSFFIQFRGREPSASVDQGFLPTVFIYQVSRARGPCCLYECLLFLSACMLV